MKDWKMLVAVVFAMALGVNTALAAGMASSKATAAINTVATCENSQATSLSPCSNTDGSGNWIDVMSANLKTSNVADLFVDVSMVTGLYTQTKSKSSGTESTSVASGTVAVRVLLDGTPGLAFPDSSGDGVIFDQRIQTLSTLLQGFVESCSPTCSVTAPEEVELILDTTAAHSFNFILLNVGTGVHTIKVQAKLSTDTTGTDPGNVSVANAVFGLGSMTVDSVRLVNDFEF